MQQYDVSFSVTASGTYRPAEASTASTSRTSDGKVQFENENYRITANDDNEVVIHNKETGENYRIWGDPHVEIDGKHAFDFWGQTTFQLDDGTKVTIGTTPWDEGGNGATVASTVTITDGDYGVQIGGVDSNTRGDLEFTEYKGGGALLDAANRDGNKLQENPQGSGFLAVDRHGNIQGVDQAFINATDELKNEGPDYLAHLGEIFSLFSGLMGLSVNGLLSSASDDDGGSVEKVTWRIEFSFSVNA